MGDYHYHGKLAYDPALQEYREALRLDPNNVAALSGIAFVLRRQGDMRQAAEYLLKALDLDPRDFQAVYSVGETYTLLREYDNALPYLEKAALLSPETTSPYDFQSRIHLLKDGNAHEARALIESLHKRKLALAINISAILCICVISVRGTTRCRDSVSGPREIDDQYVFKPQELLVAQAAGLMRNDRLAQEKYDSARQMMETDERPPGGPPIPQHLGSPTLAWEGRTTPYEKGSAEQILCLFRTKRGAAPSACSTWPKFTQWLESRMRPLMCCMIASRAQPTRYLFL